MVAEFVPVEPSGERGVAVGAVGVEGAVGPAGQKGADESLAFAVGLGSVAPGAEVADAEHAAGDGVDCGAVGRGISR